MSSAALVQKILAAAADAGYVQKSDRNTQQGYAYAGDEAITEKFRQAFLKQGLLCYPESIEVTDAVQIPRQGKDVPNVLVTLQAQFIVTDGEAQITVASAGQGMDVGDKAVYKALTGLKKYAYRMVVMMVTGDDPEVGREDEATKPRGARNEDRSSVALGADGGASGAAASGARAGSVKPQQDSMSDSQRKRIFALGSERGLTKQQLGSVRQLITGKFNSAQMTRTDAGNLIEVLSNEGMTVAALTGGAVVTA